MASRDLPAQMPIPPDRLFDHLKQKYHPVLMEVERRGKLEEVRLENSRLYIRAQARTPDDKNFIFDEIRMIDPELEEVTADIQVARGQG